MMFATSGVGAGGAQSRLAAAKVDLAWHPHISVWVIMVAVAVAYWYAFTRIGPQVAGAGVRPYTTRQRNWVVFGLVSMWIFADYPIHDISEKYLFFVHMLQHSVFTLVAPAALLLGTPDWLFRRVLSVRPIGAIVRVLAHPLIALVVFNALVAGTHFPPVVERSLHSEWVHFGVHALLFTTAALMWFPVINRVEGYPRLNTPVKMMYLFAQSIVPTVPASFLTVSETALYETYENAARMISSLSAVGDQQIAAAIMKIGGGMLLWSVVGYLFMQWWSDHQKGLADDNVKPIPAAPSAAVVPQPAPVAVGVVAGGGMVAAPMSGTTRDHTATPSPGSDPSPDADVLTWAQVRAEFDRLEREGSGPDTPQG